MVKDSDLRKANPWWKSKKEIERDREIRNWKTSEIKYDPRLRHRIRYDFESEETVVYTLRGPRQVGKTTLVKLQIKEFLENGISPWNIMYYSLDRENSQQDVVDVTEAYMRLSKRHRGKNRSYIFLDEASTVQNWQKGIKWQIDHERILNCTLLVTGSQAINIKNAAERLPMRKGRIKEPHHMIMLPMKFVEYVELLNKDIATLVENKIRSTAIRKILFNKLLNREIHEIIDDLNVHIDELNELLYEYMLTGGTPKIVDENIKNNQIVSDIYSEYLDGINGEWAAQKKDEILLRQFCGALIRALGSHISWNDLKQEAELGSHNTAIDYAHTLANLFVLSIFHRYGEKRKIPLIQKDRKFYFHDPFYLHIFNGWLESQDPFEVSERFLSDEINQGKVVEGIIGNHLIRWAFALSENRQTFDYFNHVFYWKDDKNREVDFILYHPNRVEVPIEVKYRNRIYEKELGGITNFLDQTKTKSGLVISKETLDVKNDYVILPASVFLMLI